LIHILWWFALRDYYTPKNVECKGLFSAKMHIFAFLLKINELRLFLQILENHGTIAQPLSYFLGLDAGGCIPQCVTASDRRILGF
jgi:hypothetical protein